MRETPFINNAYYHIYNRGVDKRTVFEDRRDQDRFLESVAIFNDENSVGSIFQHKFQDQLLSPSRAKDKLVNIIAYCLNPNHFHFILEQLVDGGISEFMKRLGGYTSYFNNKYERSGSLFQGVFKSIHIDSNEYLLHVSSYVNLNDRVHQLGGSASKLVKSMSSWGEYTDKKTKGICEKDIILGQFRVLSEYKRFALSSFETILERKGELKDIREFLLE